MNDLVNGGSGRFVIHGTESALGSALCDALSGSGHAVSRVRAGDAEALRAALPGAAAVAHCILGAPALIDRCAALLYEALPATSPPVRVVHVSSMTVYGSATGRVDEAAATPADLGDYSRAQQAAETRARAHPATVVLRPGVEYGPGCLAWSGRVARWLQAFRLGDLGARGDGICNLVYLDDLRDVVLACLTRPGLEGRTFNVVGRERPTWNEYFLRYALALRAVPVQRIGGRRLQLETRLLAPPLKVAERVLALAGLSDRLVPPPIPPSLLATCRQTLSLSNTAVERALAPHWTELEQGLARAAAFYG